MNIVVMGAQWGDEGKGKIVDYLAEDAKYVCRFAGGANAGHTIVAGGKKYALHQVPSGILYSDKTVFLGSGMVIDPEALFAELKMLSENGIDWKGRVFISDRAHLTLPGYREMDKKRDSERKRPIGTTGRGIGTTYSQKSERDGIRLADLDWDEKMNDLDPKDRDFLAPYMDYLLAMRIDIASKMWEIRKENVLFEGAQGAMLDIDSGTYPYVSSGASCSAGASTGAGIGPRAIDKIYGVFKAYETRVGNGPMPTEFNAESESELCDYVRNTGNEFGVTTGRARRCGYLDLVALRYACRVNSIDSLVLTHLDVYDEMEEIEACIGYDIDGETVTDFPTSIPRLNRAKPILQKFTGWKKSIKGLKDYESLPTEAKSYIDFIENFTGTKVGIVSVGPDRNQTFNRETIWR
ncbi:MAG: adenylosuccinate synthase [Treponemataceae bacterium]|nr:adenylosuccinate synthase [Treponemataceae bacterium]